MKKRRTKLISVLTLFFSLLITLVAEEKADVLQKINSPVNWIKDREDGEGAVVLIDNPEDGKCIELWNGIKDSNTDRLAHFRKYFKNPLDFSNFKIASFKMKGNGLKNALKIAIQDTNGLIRLYGPFWTDNKHWVQFEFILRIPTWKSKKDKGFRLDRITMLAFVQDSKDGKPKTAKSVLIKDFIFTTLLEGGIKK